MASKKKLRKELDLDSVDLDELWLDERFKVQQLINELKERQLNYPILDFELQPHQQKLADAIAKRNPDGTPYYKFVIMIGWNGWGKTITWAWITMSKALGGATMRKRGKDDLWTAPQTLIATSTWNQIIQNLEPYLLWTWTDMDDMKIPKEEIKGRPRKEKDVLKDIKLQSWGKINFGTYDQWQARLQGWSPHFTWLDEVPERWDDFLELIRWTRREDAQFLITFTPTNFNQNIYNWMYWEETSEDLGTYWKGRKFILEVDSLENKKADHSWMKGLSEEELQIRRLGKFVPPTWLVYKHFTRQENVIPHFNPREMWEWVKFYWALDFWVKHPMAFLFIAVDADQRIYVFDMIYWSNILLEDLKKKVDAKKAEYWWINFEWIVADSQDARSIAELKAKWMQVIPANKQMKGDNNMSNRKAWIFKINQLLANQEMIISDGCKDLMTEFETHHYATKGVDGAVVKETDDALDALRYFIFKFKVQPFLKSEKKNLKRRKNRGNNRNRKPKKY